MKGSDRFLLAIVAIIIGLVVLALVVVAGRPKPGYQPDDTPQGVVNNYLFAIEQADYDRAYSYLSPSLPGYPADVDKFAREFDLYRSRFYGAEAVSLSVEQTVVTTEHATVTVNETVSYPNGLFGVSSYTDRLVFELRLDEGAWHIAGSNSSYYWAWCWENKVGC